MDNTDVIHRVVENIQSLLELHSADGASFYFTYIYYVFEKYNYIRLRRIVILESYHTRCVYA